MFAPVTQLKAIEKFKAAVRTIWSFVDSFVRTSAALGTLALLTTTFITMFRGWFGFPMVRIFEATFDEIRRFVHLGLEWGFYYWIALALDWLCYCTTLLLSTFLPIVPFMPNLSVPAWLKDAALISIVILRVFESAYVVVPREERDQQRENTTREQKAMIRSAQGRYWGAIHYFIDTNNRRLYNVRDRIINKLTYPLRSLGVEKNNIVYRITKKFVREVFGGVLMWGYLRLAGYLVYLPPTRKLDAPTLKSVRKTFIYFCVSLFAALVATAVWFLVNKQILALI